MSEQVVSYCGMVCFACEDYPDDCKGGVAENGKPFWTKFVNTDTDICDIYRCCLRKRQHSHCGQCTELPCSYYYAFDPTKFTAENERVLQEQLELLKSL